MICKLFGTRNMAMVLAVAAASSLGAGAARATIAGFGDGSAFTLSGYTQDDSGNIVDHTSPTISSGTLTLTTPTAGEARAAYFNTAQAIGSFTAQFVYRNDASTEGGVGGPTDGFAFVLQNDSRGLSAIGGGGAGLGYGLQNNNQPPSGPPLTAITPSAADEFYLRNGTGATEYETGGTADFGSADATNPVDLADGDPILVTLVYDGSLLTETLKDQTTADTFTKSYAANIASAVGGSTAFVGFTGGTGGAFSTQTISNFTFGAVPEPASLGLLGVGALGLMGRRRRA